MVILITGATGFVMSALARYLAEHGHHVVVADLKPPGAALRAYPRMVLRSMPVARAISLWLLPSASSVWMVVCLFGFKTFNSSTSTVLGRSVHVLSKGGRRRRPYNPLPISSGGGV